MYLLGGMFAFTWCVECASFNIPLLFQQFKVQMVNQIPIFGSSLVMHLLCLMMKMLPRMQFLNLMVSLFISIQNENLYSDMRHLTHINIANCTIYFYFRLCVKWRHHGGRNCKRLRQKEKVGNNFDFCYSPIQLVDQWHLNNVYSFVTSCVYFMLAKKKSFRGTIICSRFIFSLGESELLILIYIRLTIS